MKHETTKTTKDDAMELHLCLFGSSVKETHSYNLEIKLIEKYLLHAYELGRDNAKAD